VNAVINLRVPYNSGKPSPGYTSGGFQNRTRSTELTNSVELSTTREATTCAVTR
jgi:hypothetical protein